MSNTASGVMFITAATAVVAYNLRQWQRDQETVRRRRAEPEPQVDVSSASPRVSILAAAWNEAHIIERHITSIRPYLYPNTEYIVCAGGPDGTYDRAKRLEGAGVTVLEQRPGEGKQRALQRCLELATGDLIVLMDGDVVLEPGVLSRLVQPWLAEGEPVISGGLRPLPEQRDDPFVLYQWATLCYAAAHSPRYVPGLQGMLSAIERRRLLEVGGFNQPVRIGTDYVLAKRLIGQGYRIRHVWAARGATEFPERFGDYRRQRSRWLRNIILHGLRFHDRPQWQGGLLTLMVGLGMMVAPLLVPLVGGTVLALWLAALLHRVLAQVRTIQVAQQVEGIRWRWRWYLRLPQYVLADFAVWALTLRDLLSQNARERW